MGSCYESIPPSIASSGPNPLQQAQDLQWLMDQDARVKISWLINVAAHAYPSQDNRVYLRTLIPATPETSQVDPAMQAVIGALNKIDSGTVDFELGEKAIQAINALFPRLSSPMTVQLAH